MIRSFLFSNFLHSVVGIFYLVYNVYVIKNRNSLGRNKYSPTKIKLKVIDKEGR